MRHGDFRVRWGGGVMGILLAVIGLACGGDNGTKPPPPVKVPDFALLDTNPHSLTYLQQVALSSFAGKTVMIFFGEEYCSTCKAELQKMETAIDSVATEGITAVAGMMINMHGPSGASAQISAQYLQEWATTLPVLYDTTDTAHGYDAVGHLIGCENFNDFLIVDRDGYRWKKTSVGEDKALDLTKPADFETLLGWLRELDAE
jgi:thiol-disulfide isomerase/thioredoxin